VRPTIRLWLLLATSLIAWGCNRGSAPTTTQLPSAGIVLTSVQSADGRACIDAYTKQVALELNKLKAEGRFDLAHECRCLPQTGASIKDQYLRRSTNWEFVEVSLGAPFSVASNTLTKWWRGKMISAIIVAKYRDVTLVFLGYRSKGQLLFMPFEYNRGSFDFGNLECH